MIDDPQKVSEAFNVRFGQLGKILVKTLNLVNQPPLYYPISPTRSFSLLLLLKRFTHLLVIKKIKKAVRENDINNKLLKLSYAVISPFLCYIFNSCIHQGEFPNSLKIAEVVPVFKKGDSNLLTNYHLISNYRLISILFSNQQNFKKLIFNRISDYLEKYYLFSDKQFIF